MLKASHRHGELGPGRDADPRARARAAASCKVGDLMRPLVGARLDRRRAADDRPGARRSALVAVHALPGPRCRRRTLHGTFAHQGPGDRPTSGCATSATCDRTCAGCRMSATIRPVAARARGVSLRRSALRDRDQRARHRDRLRDVRARRRGFVRSGRGRVREEESGAGSRSGDGSVSGAGSLSLLSLEDAISRRVPEVEVNSVGGLVIERLGRLPRSRRARSLSGVRKSKCCRWMGRASSVCACGP